MTTNTENETQDVVAAVTERLGEGYELGEPLESLQMLSDDVEPEKPVTASTDDTKEDGESTNDLPESDTSDSEDTREDAEDEVIAGPNAALVQMAANLGVSEDAIRAFGTDDALRTHLEYVVRNNSGGTATAETKVPDPEPLDEFSPYEWPNELLLDELNDDVVAHLAAVKSSKEHTDQYLSKIGREVKQIQQTLGQVNNFFAQQQAQQDQQWFESEIEQLVKTEPEWGEVFGAKSFAETKTQKHKNAWKEVWNEVVERAQSNARRTNPLTPKDLFKRAVNAVHGDTKTQLARKALIAKDAAMAEEHGTLLPTARKGDASRHPDEVAVANVTKFLKDKH